MECMQVQQTMWADGPDAAPRSHLETCATCRLEARRAADLQAALSGLATRIAAPPVSLEEALVALAQRRRLDRAREVVTHPRFWRSAAVGAAAAATAAVGVLVARRRTAARTAAAA